MSRQEHEPTEITITKGELSREDLTSIAHSQIDSPRPQQIRVREGMGFAIYSSERIRELKKLDPQEKKEETQEIIDAMLTADVISIENPTPKVDINP